MLSIIIPVYNGEMYLEKCIDSLLDTTIEMKEIIVVNDGSTDNTLDIALKYQVQYPNVVVVNQDNAGVSVARNTGLKFAKGEFVTFVDCDDWVEKDIYEYAVDRMIKENVDMIQFGHLVTDGSDKSISLEKQIELNIKENIFAQLYADKMSITPSVCDKIFRKKIIENEQFLSEYRYGEDIVFLYSVLNKCYSIIVSNKIGYYYYMHDKSATQDPTKVTLKKTRDSLETLEIALKFCPNDIFLIRKIEKRIFEGIVAWSQFICRYIFKNQNELSDIREYIRLMAYKYKTAFLNNPYLNRYWKVGVFFTTKYCNTLILLAGINAFKNKLRK